MLEFEYKSSLRKLLRNNTDVRYSSIYMVSDKNYILVESKRLKLFAGVRICNTFNNFEELIKKWAYAEINISLEFIKFECQTTLVKKGRLYLLDNVPIIRTFDYLADIFTILNYTSDSFSDGGNYKNIDALCEHAITQITGGCDILDIGVESTNPNSKPLMVEHEIDTLKIVLQNLLSLRKHYSFKISIDTYHQETISWLIDQDIDIINDVSGNTNIELVKMLSLSNKKYVAMHSLSVPVNKNLYLELDYDPVHYIYSWMDNKIKQFLDAKINLDNIILDPGIGFGNLPSQAWHILKNFKIFYNLPCELLLGHSRKSFLGHVTNKPAHKRDLETMLIALKFINNIDYLRLHDVSLINDLYPIMHQFN